MNNDKQKRINILMDAILLGRRQTNRNPAGVVVDWTRASCRHFENSLLHSPRAFVGLPEVSCK
jgi:hypothetical protein